MKIVGPPLQAPVAGKAGTVVRTSKDAALSSSAPSPAPAGNSTYYSGRPVRINRFDEGAALFAYTKQAHLDLHKPDAQVDEYV